MNFNFSHAAREKEHFGLLQRILSRYLGEYFENIKFDYSIGKEGFSVYAQDVEFRKDLLKKFGVPLELSTGKIDLIKISMGSFINLNNFSVLVEGINAEVSTIHISKNYKENYKNNRQKVLDGWERDHKNFFANLEMSRDPMLDKVLRKLIPAKLDIKDINIKVTDALSSPTCQKQLEVNIGSIHSFGTNADNKAIEEIPEEEKYIRRILLISGMIIKINSITSFKTKCLGNLSNHFNLSVKFTMIRKDVSFKTVPMIDLKVGFTTALIFTISAEYITILQNLVLYLTNVKNVEKYWCNRPEIVDESKISKTEAGKWFSYAFKVLREEIRNNKKQSVELSTMIERLITMETYIKYYKESHKLIIAPWIQQKERKNDLELLEAKMSIDDILFCRKIAFAELLTEGRTFCESGEVGTGYKPFVHLWEFYVNDLRSKWMKQEGKQMEINLSENERRELMKIWKQDEDNIILSYIKGQSNHPDDYIMKLNVTFDFIMVNYSRKAKSYSKKNYETLVEYYSHIYNNSFKESLSGVKLLKKINQLDDKEISEFIRDEAKKAYENELDESMTERRSFNDPRSSMSYANESKLNEEDSVAYLDDKGAIDNDKDNKDDLKEEEEEESIRKSRARAYSGKMDNKGRNNKIFPTYKVLASILLFGTEADVLLKRNEDTKVKISMEKMEMIDHNYTYILMNDRSKEAVNEFKRIFNKVFGYSEKQDSKSLFGFDDPKNQKDSKEQKNFTETQLKTYLIETFFKKIERNEILGYFTEENDFFNQYEKFIGLGTKVFKQKGIATIKKHFETIILDYLIKKGAFEELRERMIIRQGVNLGFELAMVKKREKLIEITDSILKKFITENYEKLLSNKEGEDSMLSDLTEAFENIIKRAIELSISYELSSFYPYFLKAEQLSQKITDNRIPSKDKDQFLKVLLFKAGRNYPNFINPPSDIKEAKSIYVSQNQNTKSSQMMDDTHPSSNLKETDNDAVKDIIELNQLFREHNLIDNNENNQNMPGIRVDGEIDLSLNFKLTNETIAEIIISTANIKLAQSMMDVNNIITDLTRSYLDIFDDFREIRAKREVLKKLDIKNKEMHETNGKIEEPTEMYYIESLEEHLKFLTSLNFGLKFAFKKGAEIIISMYDKAFFIDNDKLSFLTVKLGGITASNKKLEKLPEIAELEKSGNPSKIDDLNKINKLCDMIFQLECRVKHLKITQNDVDEVLSTDVKLNMFSSIVRNTVFLPDLIIDAHSDKIEIKITPNILKSVKNGMNLALFLELYGNNEPLKTGGDVANNLKKIIQNNFDRFQKNIANLYSTGNLEEAFSVDSTIKSLKYYLEQRSSMIVNYTIGSHDNDILDDVTKESGLIIRIVYMDQIGLEIPNKDFFSKFNPTLFKNRFLDKVLKKYRKEEKAKKAAQKNLTSESNVIKKSNTLYEHRYEDLSGGATLEEVLKTEVPEEAHNDLRRKGREHTEGEDESRNSEKDSDEEEKPDFVGKILKKVNSINLRDEREEAEKKQKAEFYTLRTNLLIFSLNQKFFYRKMDIYLNSLKGSKKNSFALEFDKSQFKFSFFDRVFCPLLVESLGTGFNVIDSSKFVESLSHEESFSFDIPKAFSMTNYFYENSSSKPDGPTLRDIYASRFTPIIPRIITENELPYLSNIELNVTNLLLNINFKGNKNLIMFIYYMMQINNYMSNENFLREILESSGTNKKTIKDKKEKITDKKTNLVNLISPMTTLFNINNINIRVSYEDSPYADYYKYQEEDEQSIKGENNDDSLYLNLSIDNVTILENTMTEIRKSENLTSILKVLFRVQNLILFINIPKKIPQEVYETEEEVNLTEFDEEIGEKKLPLVTLRDFKKVLEYSDAGKLWINIRTVSLSLEDDIDVSIIIKDRFAIGMSVKNGDDIPIVFFSSDTNTEQIEYYLFSKYKLDESKIKQDNKSVDFTFTFADKGINKNKDEELLQFDESVPFTNLKKMFYVMEASFKPKCIYKSEVNLKYIFIQVDDRLFHLAYYGLAWFNELGDKIKHLINDLVDPEYLKRVGEADMKAPDLNEDKNKREEPRQKRVTIKTEEEQENVIKMSGNFDILTANIPLVYAVFTFKKKTFTMFTVADIVLKLSKTSNNEQILTVGLKDVSWKVIDKKKRLRNVLCKKGENEMHIETKAFKTENDSASDNSEDKLNLNESSEMDNDQIVQIKVMLDDTAALKKKKSVLGSLKGKKEEKEDEDDQPHKVVISGRKVLFAFINKFFAETLSFFNFNLEFLSGNPKKKDILGPNFFYNQILKQESIFIELEDVNFIIPESSDSANHLLLNVDKAKLSIFDLIEPIKFVNAAKDSYVIDKDTVYDATTNILEMGNCGIKEVETHKYIHSKTILIKKTYVKVASKNKIKGTFIIDNERIVNNFINIPDGKLFSLEMYIPKLVDIVSRYFYYKWQKNDVSKAFNGLNMVINVGELNCTEFTMGNIMSFVKFIKNNFDEKSEELLLNDTREIYKPREIPDCDVPVTEENKKLFPQFDSMMKYLDLNVGIDGQAHAELDIFKFFHAFFNRKTIERIGDKLPGYDAVVKFDRSNESTDNDGGNGNGEGNIQEGEAEGEGDFMYETDYDKA
ncbi:MAG: hypothetical protein MJ252_01065 [archaeon]|nr:hypothetical protein [archaeon]